MKGDLAKFHEIFKISDRILKFLRFYFALGTIKVVPPFCTCRFKFGV